MISQETRAVPVVFVSVSDPVGEGFVASLARPGGNITGFSQYEYTIGGKWLGLLKEMAPSVTNVIVIMNAGNPASANHLRTIESVAASFKTFVKHRAVRDTPDFEDAVRGLPNEPNQGLIFLPGISNVVDRARLIGAATERRLPAIYALRADAIAGGLITYGVDVNDQYRRAASYIDRILKGEKPGDLPVQTPIKYELVINLKAAKALGLEVPPTLSARADEVIE
jgi:putative ABC transport system substrate-binding protein